MRFFAQEYIHNTQKIILLFQQGLLCILFIYDKLKPVSLSLLSPGRRQSGLEKTTFMQIKLV